MRYLVTDTFFNKIISIRGKSQPYFHNFCCSIMIRFFQPYMVRRIIWDLVQLLLQGFMNFAQNGK